MTLRFIKRILNGSFGGFNYWRRYMQKMLIYCPLPSFVHKVAANLYRRLGSADEYAQNLAECSITTVAVLVGVLLLNCNNNTTQEQFRTKSQVSQAIVNDSLERETRLSVKHQENVKDVLPDTTINGKLRLENPVSSEEFYPNIDEINLIEYIRDSPVALFTNQQGNEYLMAYQYEGGTKNAFSCFEIGYSKDFASESPNKTLAKNFKTESNLCLGMALKDLEVIKGKEYLKKDIDSNTTLVTYRINDMDSSPFLKRYNMPGYFIECTLKNDRITKVFFGFDYP